MRDDDDATRIEGGRQIILNGETLQKEIGYQFELILCKFITNGTLNVVQLKQSLVYPMSFEFHWVYIFMVRVWVGLVKIN